MGATRGEFIFYSDRIIRLLVEEGDRHLMPREMSKVADLLCCVRAESLACDSQDCGNADWCDV